MRLPLNRRTRDYVGTIFGGSMYGAVDPVFDEELDAILAALAARPSVDRRYTVALLEAGFGEVRLFGDLEGAPYGPRATRLVAVGRSDG